MDFHAPPSGWNSHFAPAALEMSTICVSCTGSAFVVDTTQNVNQQFLDALNKIRGAALGCSYLIPLPDGGTPDFAAVNVNVFTYAVLY